MENNMMVDHKFIDDLSKERCKSFMKNRKCTGNDCPKIHRMPHMDNIWCNNETECTYKEDCWFKHGDGNKILNEPTEYLVEPLAVTLGRIKRKIQQENEEEMYQEEVFRGRIIENCPRLYCKTKLKPEQFTINISKFIMRTKCSKCGLRIELQPTPLFMNQRRQENSSKRRETMNGDAEN